MTILVAFAFAAVPVMAQDVTLTQAYIAFKNVRNPDGSITRTQGGFLPIRIEAIDAKVLSLGKGQRGEGESQRGAGKSRRGEKKSDSERSGRGFGAPSPFSSQGAVVYQNDGGTPFVGNDTPSVLDDLVLAAGSENKVWTFVKFGVHLSTASRTGLFLVRWQAWETFVAGRGPGVSAFDDLIPKFDFGFYLDRADFSAADDTFIVTADLRLEPLAAVPNRTCFFAQQFRQPQFPENGEGPFTDVWNVFADSGPQVGASQDLFYYDTLPPDGIYDELEADNFGPGFPGAGNFLLNVEVAGQTLALNPASFQWIRGNLQSGNLGSLWFDDGSYNVARAGLTLFLGEPPAQLIVETFVSSTNVIGIRFDVVAKVNTPGLNQRVELWNFTTGTWDTLSDGPATTTDSTVLSFATVANDYVAGAPAVVRAKVSWYQTGLTLLWPWTVSVDRVHWVVTLP
ncbi:MAG: hypothetical protein IIC73_02540 [Armatimonadetes bacterium]|nr:hypothetical protein [Armatimonadota bacterium]